MVEYRAGELISLQNRIVHLTEQMFDAVDKADQHDDPEISHQLKLDIYFLHGMKQLLDVLIAHPDSIYQHLHGETVAVQETFTQIIGRMNYEKDSEIRHPNAERPRSDSDPDG